MAIICFFFVRWGKHILAWSQYGFKGLGMAYSLKHIIFIYNTFIQTILIIAYLEVSPIDIPL